MNCLCEREKDRKKKRQREREKERKKKRQRETEKERESEIVHEEEEAVSTKKHFPPSYISTKRWVGAPPPLPTHTHIHTLTPKKEKLFGPRNCRLNMAYSSAVKYYGFTDSTKAS